MEAVVEALTTTTVAPATVAALPALIQPESLFTTVSLATLPLISPTLRTYVGVEQLSSVVVLLLFVGENCEKACGDYYNLAFNFYHRVNSIIKQLEVVIVSGHKTAGEMMKFVSKISNPFPAVEYRSAERLLLLEKFGLPTTTDYDSFEPKLHIMEYMGAYAKGAEPPEASVCHVVRDAYANISALDMKPLAKKPGTLARGDSWITPAALEEIPERHRESYRNLFSNDPAYRPLDKLQTIRERCNFVYAEMRDTLYQLRMHPREQSTYLKSLGVIAARMQATLPRQVSAEKYVAAVREVTRLSLNTRILDLIGAPRSELGGSYALVSNPRVNPEFLKHLLQRQYARLQPILEDDRRPTGLFPRLSLNAIPGAPVYHIKLYYRSREWSAIRESFPRSTNELLALVSEKIKDANIEVAKLFSDDLNPRYPVPGVEECLREGVTATTGSLQYSSFEEIRPQLTKLFHENIATGLVKVRIVVIGTQTRLNAVKPASDKAFVISQINAMRQKASDENALELSFLRSLLSGAIVMKLIELDEYQEQALRRIPVVSLHFKAVQDVLEFRTRHSMSGSTPPHVPDVSTSGWVSETTSPSSSLEDASSIFRRGSRSSQSESSDDGIISEKRQKLTYQEALLKRLVEWFTTDFYDWLPSSAACMRPVTPECPGVMEVCLGGSESNRMVDDDGNRIDEPIFRSYLFDDYFCNCCNYQYRVYRPVHDVVKMLEYTQGRCGEHGKAFALAARSLGFDVRLIMGEFREKEPDKSMFSLARSDHLWNEVFLESDPDVRDDQGRWVHVDVSADERTDIRTGGMGIPADKGYDQPGIYDSTFCAHKLLSAAAVGRDFVSWVLDKYLTSAESLKYAQSQDRHEFVIQDIAVLSRVVAETPVNIDARNPARDAFLHHLEHVEAVAIASRYSHTPEPKYGRGHLFKGPSNLNLEIFGGEIPEWSMRPKEQLFSSYDILMRLDGRTPWRVCRVDVFKAGEMVTEIRFGYCMGREATPSRFSSSMDMFSPTMMAHVDVAAEREPDHRTEIPEGDMVGFIDTDFNEEHTHLVNVKVHRQSELGLKPAEGKPVVGFYGARVSGPESGIEYIGYYVINRDHEL